MIIINSLKALIYQAFSEGDGAETKNAQTVSSPASRTIVIPVTALVTGIFICYFKGFPFSFPLLANDGIYELFHAICTGNFHLSRDVSIGI